MYRSGLVDTLVTHANMKGLGRTPSLGDRRGFMPPQLKTNKQTDIMRRPQTILLSSMYNLKLSTKKCQIKSGKWDKFLWPSQNIWTLIVTKDIGIYRVIFWATVATSILWACSQENHIVPYTSRQIFPLVHFRVSSILESQDRQSNNFFSNFFKQLE